MKRGWEVLVALSLSLLVCTAQEVFRLDPGRSVIQIHLETAGALGFAGHPHLIQAPVAQGSFIYYPADPGKSAVEIVVDAGALTVLDPQLSARDRQKIQATMQSPRVLDIKRYPKIVFKSVKVEALETSRLQITGNLTLRAQTHPVLVQATWEPGGLKATGTSAFKQTTFGIRPVSAGLGTVRVQDRVRISFQVFGAPKAGHGS